jgi:hypothetical protein
MCIPHPPRNRIHTIDPGHRVDFLPLEGSNSTLGEGVPAAARCGHEKDAGGNECLPSSAEIARQTGCCMYDSTKDAHCRSSSNRMTNRFENVLPFAQRVSPVATAVSPSISWSS